ncbi:gelsolin repeat protein [Opisthorchis viverrini]|uniref:Gelsolin repeat protein n=1 Tax=Opisthorchis viverrini TaxID=6198 RepID=A0A1S8WX27_OPIVI|nr:gelsolin repeat protein [Opisthorchis viverrini]
MSEYSWKDTNLALVGSEEDRNVKKKAAETEPAWKDVLSIDSTTTLVWRINQFKVEEVKKETFGKFFSGDSYIVLHTEKTGNQLLYDVHFWIGKDSTQDEYATAAYKTVELDTLLDDKAVQHREVDGFESDEFKSYFPVLEKLAGGYATGFRERKPEELPKRLLLCHGLDRRHVELTEVTFSRKSLNSNDVFILDLGTKAYQWNGQNASKDERFKASEFMQALESQRMGRCPTVVVDESDREGTNEFLSYLPDEPVHEKPKQETEKKAIYRLSDESGQLKVTLVCENNLPRGALTHDDAYFIDNGNTLFVYIGTKCSKTEKLNALAHAHEYLKGTKHPLIPITVVSEGRQSKELDKVLE